MTEGPEIKVKYTADLSELKKGSEDAKKEVGSIEPVVKKTGGAVEEMGDLFNKVSLIAGGTFVTAALALATAVGVANDQVQALDRSVMISGGAQENYAQNMIALQSIADGYHKSIFALAGGFNELTRETRGTSNEGDRTARIFDTLVDASEKIGVSVDDTTNSFSGFIDKMKQGTVDSTGLSNEIDKRLYEAFVNVAKQMSLTNDELNEVLKTSDEAVATVLPQLAQAFGDSLGDIPQKDAKDLGENIEYANSKLVTLLDSLFKVSGAKSVMAQAAEDAGGLLDQLTILSQRQGVTGAVLGLMDAGAETLFNGTGFKGPSLDYARQEQNRRNQTPSMSNFPINGEIGNYSNGVIKPSGDYDIIAAGLKVREEAEEAANKKRIADQKRLAAERKRVLDDINRQEMAEAKARVAEALSNMIAANEAAYRKNNGITGPLGQLDHTGITTGLDNGLKKTQVFTNETKGDGSALNFDRAIATMDDTIQKIEARYARLKDVTTRQGKELEEGIRSSLEGSVVAALEGLGDIGAGLATGTLTLETVGNTFLGIMATLFEGIGKALAAHAAALLLAEIGISSLNPVVSAAGAALAFAAAGVARSQMQSSSSDAVSRFYTGGIPYGVDNIPAMVSHDEMIINSGQQATLFSILDGASGRNLTSPNFKQQGSGSSGGELKGRLTGELRGSTLALAADIGSIDNDYFRG